MSRISIMLIIMFVRKYYIVHSIIYIIILHVHVYYKRPYIQVFFGSLTNKLD